MDARGTSTMEELLGDATSKPDKEYLGYKVYSVVDNFYKEILEVRSVIALQDPEGKILVLMDLVNRSDQDLSIGIDNIVADGKPTAIELWKSEKFKPSEHLILSIAINELVESFENAAFPLHVYGADGEELLTTEPIS